MSEEKTSPEAPEVETNVETPEVELDDAEGLGLQSEDEIAKAMGIFDETKEDDGNEDDTKDEEPSEKEEAPADEPKEEEKSEPEEEAKPEVPEEPKAPEIDPQLTALQAENELYKERYANSTREFETKYKPMEENLKKLETEREKLADIISSDPQLSAAFLKAAEGFESVPTPATKPSTDAIREEVLASVKQELAPLFEQQKSEGLKKEQEREKAILTFESEHPGLTDADRGKLGATERFLRESFGFSQKEALDRAWITCFPDKATEKAVSTAKSEALAKSTQNAKATTQKVSGISKPSSAAALTPEQLRVAKKFGLSAEEYASTLPKE